MSLQEEWETALTCWKPSHVKSPPAMTGELWGWRSAFLTMRNRVALVRRFLLSSASTVMVRCFFPWSTLTRVEMLKCSPNGSSFCWSQLSQSLRPSCLEKREMSFSIGQKRQALQLLQDQASSPTRSRFSKVLRDFDKNKQKTAIVFQQVRLMPAMT